MKLIKKDNANYKNENYKISKFSSINILIIILIIISMFYIDFYNKFNHDKLIENQKEIALKYLKGNYPKYKFKIIDSHEEGADCWMFGCRRTVLNVEVENIDTNESFSILVNKDLTIYKDEFKEE